MARRRVHQSSGAVVRCPEQAGRPFRIVADSPRLHSGDYTRAVEITRECGGGRGEWRRRLRALLAPERAPRDLYVFGESV